MTERQRLWLQTASLSDLRREHARVCEEINDPDAPEGTSSQAFTAGQNSMVAWRDRLWDRIEEWEEYEQQ